MGEQQQHSAEQVVQKLRAADQMLAQGAAVGTVARKLGVTEQTYQQWRAQGAGLSTRERPNPVPAKEAPKNNPQNHSQGNSQNNTASSSPKFPVRREESWEMFGLFVNAILADVAVTRSGPPSDVPMTISPKLVRALLYLAQHGGRAMTVGELAEGVGVSLGWASRVADELVAIGLLERIRDDHDRRVVQLQLTPRATVISGRLWSDREDAIVAALSEVFPEERQVIARFLRRLTAELESHASKSTPARP
jgi:DNA-binding MarR family transcriptional regulator/transposase-like protein